MIIGIFENEFVKCELDDGLSLLRHRWLKEPSAEEFKKNLAPKYQEALQLVDIEGITQVELAHRLGISISGAKSRVQRGRQQLKQKLIDCCPVKTDQYGNILEIEHKNGQCGCV